MSERAHRALFAIYLLVVAPIGAAVVVAVLLLFGVRPQTVFAPGWALKSFMQSYGVRTPNAVGVLATVALWWAVFVAVAIAWDLRPSRRAARR